MEKERKKQELLDKQKTKKGDDKQQKIIDDKKREDEDRMIKQDEHQFKNWADNIEALASVGEVASLENKLLDLLLGIHRVTDGMDRFPAVANAFQTTDAQAKVLVKVIKNVRTAMKKIQLDKLSADRQPAVRKFIVYFICMVQEAFK